MTDAELAGNDKSPDHSHLIPLLLFRSRCLFGLFNGKDNAGFYRSQWPGKEYSRSDYEF